MSIDQTVSPTSSPAGQPSPDVHQMIGVLTRQLHDSLNGLGLTEKIKGSVEELPDAKSRLTYIAKLTGEAAEKVLNSVDQAKAKHDRIAEETRRIAALIVKDPVAAVAKGHIMNFVSEVDQSSKEIDQHLTDIMMAQDFHDLTGQVIARVVNLAATIEQQLVNLLIQTAPPESVPVKPAAAPDYKPALSGPAINAEGNPDVVSGQSEVDDLLASLGF
jgi:chemotaxis protein CheZ